MPDLAAFQQSFLDAVTGSARAPGPLTVYLNTALSGAVDALADNYPVVRALVGEAMFAAVAADYGFERPPRSPILALYGEDFADWIAAAGWSAQTPYLADVAHLERLYIEALFAADMAPLPADALAGLAPEAWMTLRLPLHPALRARLSPTPAVSIWVAHQHDEPGEIAPDWIPEGALITRPRAQVEVRRLDDAEFAFLTALRGGATVGEAAIGAATQHPGADLGRALQIFLEAGVFAAPN